MIWLRRIGRLVLCLLALVGLAGLIIGALVAAPSSQPPELVSVRAGALAIDQSGLPDLKRLKARDGTALAYRLYPAANGSTHSVAILIHGSAGHSTTVTYW